MRLRSIWLSAVIGWNEGREVDSLAKAAKAHARAVAAKRAWYALNPHDFNPKPEDIQ